MSRYGFLRSGKLRGFMRWGNERTWDGGIGRKTNMHRHAVVGEKSRN